MSDSIHSRPLADAGRENPEPKPDPLDCNCQSPDDLGNGGYVCNACYQKPKS